MPARQPAVEPGQHPGQLGDPGAVVEHQHAAAGHRPVVALDDKQVAVGERRDLRQVRHDDDLVAAGQHRQAAAYLDRRLAADPGVDLVEDHQRHRVGAGEHHLDGQHHPRQLTAGRAPVQGPRRGAPVRLEQQLDIVDPVRCHSDAPAVDHQAIVGLALGDRRGDQRVRHRERGQLSRDPRPEPGRRRLPAPGQLTGQRPQLSLEPGVLGRELPDALIDPVELEQPGRGPVGPEKDPVDAVPPAVRGVVAVPPHQRRQGRQPLLGHRKPCRVGVHPRGVGGEVTGDVGGEEGRFGHPDGQRAEHGVVGGRRLERPAGRGEQLQGVDPVAGLLAGQRRLRAGRRGPQVVGVGQPLDLGLEGGAFAPQRRDRLDLGEPEPEQLGLAQPLRRGRPELRAGGPDLAPPDPAGPEAVPPVQHLRPGVPVEGRALAGRLQQALLVALTVDREHAVGQLAQHGHRDAAPTDVRPAAAVGPDTATEQQHPVVVERTTGVLCPVDRGVVAGQGQPALHDRPR